MRKMLALSACCLAPAELRIPNVEVFRTNVRTASQAALVISVLRTHFDGFRVTLDLEDCDKVLRVQSFEPEEVLPEAAIMQLVEELGFWVEVLAD